MNRALVAIPKRAERQGVSQLHDTFVDSGVATGLDVVDHQVLYGRRGTGKTHALAYLSSEVKARGDLPLYIDLRVIGSPGGLLNAESGTAGERATRLLIDLLGALREELLGAVLDDTDLIDDPTFIDRADDLLASISNMTVLGEVEQQRSSSDSVARDKGARGTVRLAPDIAAEGSASASRATTTSTSTSETVRGTPRVAINFREIAGALQQLTDALNGKRIWLLLDEWSSVPRDLQPYLSEFLVRCVLPLPNMIVKIAAIEQQTNFRTVVDGNTIGIELGADMGAHLNLDDYLVYEGNEQQSRDFFRRLFFKHLKFPSNPRDAVADIESEWDVIRLGFTDKRAFDELIRAAEGVPRDALNIASRAATRAREERISVPIVRNAARDWFQTDKSNPLESKEEAQRLLQWIIDRVIREKRARAFLVRADDARYPLLQALFDARVLHVVRRGYSAQDTPGVRYDVWVIDYGAYVDLVQTQYAPQGALPLEMEDGREAYAQVDVPMQDLRAIRRAVLDLDEFERSA